MYTAFRFMYTDILAEGESDATCVESGLYAISGYSAARLFTRGKASVELRHEWSTHRLAPAKFQAGTSVPTVPGHSVLGSKR